MVGHGAKFDRKKEEAIAALLSQRNVEEAARAVGITANTLLRWQKVPEFATAYRRARPAACAQSTARLQQVSAVVVSTLLKVTEFKIVREFNGNLLTQEYRGTVSGSDLKLTVSGDRVGPMDVVFKKQ